MSDLANQFQTENLGVLATVRRGITYSTAMLVERDSGIPYVNMKSFKKGGGFNWQGVKYYDGGFAQDDLAKETDLLIVNTDVTPEGDIVGTPAFLPDELRKHAVLFSHHVTRLRLEERIDPEYLFYLLCTDGYRRWMLGSARGTTVLMLDMAGIKRIPVTYHASRTTQKRIVSILQTIDQAIEKTEALIEKYQQIKAGLMNDLFTRGIGTDGKLRPPREQAPELYQQTPIGWIPKDWQFEFLDHLSQRGSGHTPDKNTASYWNGGVKWVSLADSRKLDDLHISDTDLEISVLGIQNSSAVLHSAGTVVMTRDAGVGKSAIITEPMAVSQHFMAWKCGEKINNYFLYYWLQLNKRTFENVAMGSTIVTIGLPYFKKLKVAAPAVMSEQIEIGEKLKSADSHIQSLKSDLKKLKQQKSGLMHDLLTGKVSVQVAESEPEIA